MSRKIILNSFRTDFKFILRDPMLLVAGLAPFFLILFLKLVLPLLSDFIFLKTGFILIDYYTIIAISIISLIPMLIGMVYAFILLDENDTHILQVIEVTPAGKINYLYLRMIVPLCFTFFMLSLAIVLTDPVPGEGWLRSLFVCFLLSAAFPFTFLFIGSLAGNKVEGLALSKLLGIFLIAVPLGLILHHPWNYFAFFSPFYWISWSWVIPDPAESMLYGAIALIVTLVSVMVFFRHFLRKYSN